MISTEIMELDKIGFNKALDVDKTGRHVLRVIHIRRDASISSAIFKEEIRCPNMLGSWSDFGRGLAAEMYPLLSSNTLDFIQTG